MTDEKYYYISKGIGMAGIWIGACIGAFAPGVGIFSFYAAITGTFLWVIFG